MNSQSIRVEIIGCQIACSQGVRDDWRDLAKWIGSKLDAFYGRQVVIRYYDLLDADTPPLPNQAKLPIVMVNGEVISMGGKILMGLIRKKIDSIIHAELAQRDR